MLNKMNVAQIRNDVTAALREVAEKHGVDFTLGNITFSADKMTSKVTGVVRGAAGTNPNKPVNELMLNLFNATFLLGNNYKEGEAYRNQQLGMCKFVGYNKRAHAYPFVVECLNTGKKYKVSLETAQQMTK